MQDSQSTQSHSQVSALSFVAKQRWMLFVCLLSLHQPPQLGSRGVPCLTMCGWVSEEEKAGDATGGQSADKVIAPRGHAPTSQSRRLRPELECRRKDYEHHTAHNSDVVSLLNWLYLQGVFHKPTTATRHLSHQCSNPPK